jgi:Fe2+ or Zn2+ uptake regulation protein
MVAFTAHYSLLQIICIYESLYRMKKPFPADVYREALRRKGFRVTSGKMAILEYLWLEEQPCSISSLFKKVSSLNEVTLYRALEALSNAEIVGRVDLNHGHAHYELIEGKTHHHHVICTKCGTIEDITDSGCESLIKTVAATSSFPTINRHAFEIFGVCVECS